MAKTVDLSLSTRTKQYLVAGGVSWVPATGLYGALLAATDLPGGAVMAGAAAVWLLVTALWVARLGGEDDGGTWDAIPNWQYGGRFAEVGGLTRGEQEAALEQYSDEE